MDWGKIAIAHAVNPAFGVLEYNKQMNKKREYDAKKSRIESKLRYMKEGDTARFGFVEVQKTKVTWKIRGIDFTSLYSAVDRIMMLNGDNWL